MKLKIGIMVVFLFYSLVGTGVAVQSSRPTDLRFSFWLSLLGVNELDSLHEGEGTVEKGFSVSLRELTSNIEKLEKGVPENLKLKACFDLGKFREDPNWIKQNSTLQYIGEDSLIVSFSTVCSQGNKIFERVSETNECTQTFSNETTNCLISLKNSQKIETVPKSQPSSLLPILVIAIAAIAIVAYIMHKKK